MNGNLSLSVREKKAADNLWKSLKKVERFVGKEIKSIEKGVEEQILAKVKIWAIMEYDLKIIPTCMEYDKVADKNTIERTMSALKLRGVNILLVNNKKKALEKLMEIIPEGTEIMTGASVTLEEIGFAKLLKSKEHPWKNVKDEILSEKDPEKQRELRKRSVTADYFIASVHAVSETGEVIIGSASGSQLPSYCFTSNNVIWVTGAQKIVPNLGEALKRLREYVFPLEDARMKMEGHTGSVIGKILIFEREIMPYRKVTMILVNERLGF